MRHLPLSLFCLGYILMPLLTAAPSIDRYGQFTGEDWPEKIKKDAEMRSDLEQESRELAGVKPDLTKFDRFGGVKDGAPLEATGFFRVMKIENRYWLISPEGNRFFLKGVDAVPYLERGYFTAAKEGDGKTIRKLFTQGAPDRRKYAEAWTSDGKQVNFLAANIQRKYGENFRERWMDLTEKRLLDWGFNSSGKWNNPFVFDRLPFLLDSGLPVRKLDRFIDPFDPNFAAKADAHIQKIAGKFHDNPFLIGYQFENENGWSRNTPLLFLKDRSGMEAKRALLAFLAERNDGDAGKLFGQPGAATDELIKQALDGAKLPQEQLSEFIKMASRRYHSILAESLRKYDTNHLFLAASHCGIQSVEWIEGGLDYIDLLPLHEYNLHSRWIGGFLADYLKKWDKPFAVLEYSFTNSRRGFSSFSSSITVETEADRGRAFQIYTEQLAGNPLCVGMSYFILYDQPVTSRGHDAEAFSFGLINVVDRPYREMLPLVKETNARLFDIHAGKLEPVKMLPLLKEARNTKEFLPGSLGDIRFDSSNPQFHHNRIDRIRFSDNAPLGVPLPAGTIDAGKSGGFQKLEFYVFLWKTEKNRNLDDWFKLEESADNITFEPAAAEFRLYRDGTFCEYIMTAKSLKPTTRYVRLNFILHNPAASWTTSLAEVRVERE